MADFDRKLDEMHEIQTRIREFENWTSSTCRRAAPVSPGPHLQLLLSLWTLVDLRAEESKMAVKETPPLSAPHFCSFHVVEAL